MTEVSTIDPRQQRRDVKVAQILDEAWRLAQRDGIAGISLRELAAAVGLRQPSLYVYFASKHDLYDAMFARGYRELNALVAALDPADEQDPERSLTEFLTSLLTFSSEDPVRHVLLFQRQVPGFEPSAESMREADVFYAIAVERLRSAGVTAQEDVDLFSALVSGLSNQQVANDPRGDRWVRLSERTVHMFLADVRGRRPQTTKGAKR